MSLIKWLGLYPLRVLVLMTLIGGLLAFGHTSAAPYILWLSWRQIVKPPPKAAHIVAMRSYLLYLKADDATIHECDLNSNSCNQIDAVPKFNITRETLNCPAIDMITPIWVDNISETYAQRDCLPYGYTDIHIIVLADGSVWAERDYYRYNADGLMYLGMMSCTGAVLGLLLGMISLVWIWTAESKNRRRNAHLTS